MRGKRAKAIRAEVFGKTRGLPWVDLVRTRTGVRQLTNFSGRKLYRAAKKAYVHGA